MSVLIKGIKKPKDCYTCKFKDINDCKLWVIMNFGEIHPECPIVEVKTPHGRLIDADKLFLPQEDMGSKMALSYAPTVIEAEGEE